MDLIITKEFKHENEVHEVKTAFNSDYNYNNVLP